MTIGSLMKVKSIAKCSPWSIQQYFLPALSDIWSRKPISGLLESGRFTQVLLYCTTIVVAMSPLPHMELTSFGIILIQVSRALHLEYVAVPRLVSTARAGMASVNVGRATRDARAASMTPVCK